MQNKVIEYRQPKEHGCVICGDELYVLNPHKPDLCMFHSDRATETKDIKVFLENHGFNSDEV